MAAMQVPNKGGGGKGGQGGQGGKGVKGGNNQLQKQQQGPVTIRLGNHCMIQYDPQYETQAKVDQYHQERVFQSVFYRRVSSLNTCFGNNLRRAIYGGGKYSKDPFTIPPLGTLISVHGMYQIVHIRGISLSLNGKVSGSPNFRMIRSIVGRDIAPDYAFVYHPYQPDGSRYDTHCLAINLNELLDYTDEKWKEDQKEPYWRVAKEGDEKQNIEASFEVEFRCIYKNKNVRVKVPTTDAGEKLIGKKYDEIKEQDVKDFCQPYFQDNQFTYKIEHGKMSGFDEEIDIEGNYVKFNVSSNVNADLKGVDDCTFQRYLISMYVLKRAFNDVLDHGKKIESASGEFGLLQLIDLVLNELSYKIEVLESLGNASKEFNSLKDINEKKVFLNKRGWQGHVSAYEPLYGQSQDDDDLMISLASVIVSEQDLVEDDEIDHDEFPKIWTDDAVEIYKKLFGA